MRTRPIAIAAVLIVAVSGVAALWRARVVGMALSEAPAAEPLPFSVVELRATGIDQALRGRKVLAELAPVEPFDMVDGVMRIEVDLPLAGLRGALASSTLVTTAGERFVVDEELPRTGTLRVHLER